MVTEIDERGQDAVTAAAEVLSLPPARVRIALRYHSAFPEEIEEQVAQAEEESVAAEAAWAAEQRLLA